MSTLGDPLTDIGLFCTYWAAMGSDSLIPMALGVDAPAPFPTTDDLVSSYADTSGLDMSDLPWYIAFGCFKLGVILEGIYYRHTLGKTVGGASRPSATWCNPSSTEDWHRSNCRANDAGSRHGLRLRRRRRNCASGY